MDLGLFRRSRAEFYTWLIAPIVVTLAMYYGFDAYYRHTENGVERRQAFLEAMPALRRAVAAARGTVQDLAAPVSDADTYAKALGLHVTRKANETGFLVNSLSVDRLGPELAGTDAMLRVKIKGEGTMQALARFLSEVEGPGDLVEYERADVWIKTYEEGVVYLGEFTMLVHVVLMP